MHPNWPSYLRILLFFHIAAGTVAFVCAPIALIAAKGRKTHRLYGKIYFWAMAAVAVTALTLSFALPIYFLAMVSVFSFYASFAAYRILYLKDLPQGGKPRVYDWMAAVITVASSLLLCLLGFVRPLQMHVGIVRIAGHRVSIVSVVFGLLGMRLGLSSIIGFLRPSKEKMFWWFDHMQGMMASYIAALTAFSAVNLGRWFGDAWWVWLWPTMVGVPAISLWSAHYKRKFATRSGTA